MLSGANHVRNRFVNAMAKHEIETHGLKRSPTRANFQKVPRNLWKRMEKNDY